jgi:hypothetical protein
MEIEIKDHYEAPEVLIVGLKTEGIVCVSGGDYPNWDGEDI